MAEFPKIISQAELLTKSRELRDRVEISLHKLGPGAKGCQQNLNNIVATLSVQNAHPVDDKQSSLFDSPRVGQPKRAVKKTKFDRMVESDARKTKQIQAERTAAGRTNTLKPKPKECWRCGSKRNLKSDGPNYSICNRCETDAATTKKVLKSEKKSQSVKKSAASVKKSGAVPKKAVRKHMQKAEFMRPMQATPELQAIVGSKPLPRTDVTKKIWDYIKMNGLQDKSNKRNINVDEKLAPIFANKKGVAPAQVSMFEMTKLVARHLS